MRMSVFWDVTPCSRVETDRRFRGSYCLHHQGDELLRAQPWSWRQCVSPKRWRIGIGEYEAGVVATLISVWCTRGHHWEWKPSGFNFLHYICRLHTSDDGILTVTASSRTGPGEYDDTGSSHRVSELKLEIVDALRAVTWRRCGSVCDLSHPFKCWILFKETLSVCQYISMVTNFYSWKARDSMIDCWQMAENVSLWFSETPTK
jgi:hypothetical protein